MSNLTSSLKSWGATGAAYPDAYSYTAGERPVDAWDNFLTDNIIKEIQGLQNVVNDRLETDSGAAHPASPEVGHLSLRTDAPANANGDELYVYDADNTVFHRLLRADGDTLSGALDLGGNGIVDATGRIALSEPVTIDGADLDTEWHSKQEGGTIGSAAYIPILTTELAAGETLHVTQAMLTEDGFTTPVASGVDLVIADENDEADPATATPTTVLAGDGLTLFSDETGAPLASYTNSTTGPLVVTVGIDNGHYGTGTGSRTGVYAGYIARVV